MVFATEYAERLLMNQIYKKSWESVLEMMVTLDKIPDAHSWERRIHHPRNGTRAT
jgi:hypothetical protein